VEEIWADNLGLATGLDFVLLIYLIKTFYFNVEVESTYTMSDLNMPHHSNFER